ncbi:DUF2382 domain-containing protein, partial [Falsiroseomonas oryzae]|uniref:DUF2382 domain-containing protein n=1 Tax=Falsiroseomonas oryzae TaxID=2766473 RepID=UPI0022EA5D5E
EARAAEAVRQEADAVRQEAEAARRRTRESARQLAEAATRPMTAAADMARQMTRMAASGSDSARLAAPRASASALTNLFFAPWMGMMQGLQTAPARNVAGAEEVIPLGEEVLEVGKRTENRGTARIRRYVVETPVEREVTLQQERVVVERRRPVGQTPTGEVLTEVTVEVVETAEVPVVQKYLRLREEVVVRTERSQRVETVRETLRRDEVEIQQPSERGRRPQLRPVGSDR